MTLLNEREAEQNSILVGELLRLEVSAKKDSLKRKETLLHSIPEAAIEPQKEPTYSLLPKTEF